jgi:hypothetical protein
MSLPQVASQQRTPKQAASLDLTSGGMTAEETFRQR